jgi:hypothetical protein
MNIQDLRFKKGSKKMLTALASLRTVMEGRGRRGRRREIGGGDFTFHISDSKTDRDLQQSKDAKGEMFGQRGSACPTKAEGSHRVRQESDRVRLSAVRKCLEPNLSFASASPSFAYL